MPHDQFEPRHESAAPQGSSNGDLSSIIPRMSFKAGLAVFLSVGFFLFLLSRSNFLLIYSLIEVASVVLLTAAFLVVWKTRTLVSGQFFLVLAVGLFAAKLIGLLHVLFRGSLRAVTVASVDMSTQLWLAGGVLGALAFLVAAINLGRGRWYSSAGWLVRYLCGGAFLVALIWPVRVFPSCYVEGLGATSFLLYGQGLLLGVLGLSAVILWRRKRFLNHQIVMLLLTALGMSALAGLLPDFHMDGHELLSFLGHYFDLGSALLVYSALGQGTVNSLFATFFKDIGKSYEELNQELQRRRVAETWQEAALCETTLLYRMSRAMHSTLNLDELSHLMLSAATGVSAGGFERAMLFTANRRTGTLQGMLGVSRELSPLVLPAGNDSYAWQMLHLDEVALEAQRRAPFNQLVVKQRLLLDRDDNALARAFLDKEVVVVTDPQNVPAGGRSLADALDLGPYACVPLAGRNQVQGVLLVDNPLSRRPVSPANKRFLELFASQAGSALDNAGLMKRLEIAHDNLQDIQEQLIHSEKMAVLGEMAAQVAHELRNPLVSIGGFARRLAKQDLANPQANEYATIIAREVRRLEEMLSNILGFSSKQLVCLDRCCLGDVLRELFDLEYEGCRRQGIELVCDLPDDLPEIVGDARQLRQVFLNLIINARHAMGGGGVLTVRIGTGSLRGCPAVQVEVEDTGGGISPEVMRNIFNPFFSTFEGGTGLGLSISHRIVAHHHGEIEVINGERGARFIVLLPVQPPVTTRLEIDDAEQVE